MEGPSYAYTLRNREPGWAWCVYDVEGALVASGTARSRTDALAAVSQLISPREPAPIRQAG